MLGVVIVTHGNLANEFVRAAEHVVGKQEQVAAISIAPNDDMAQCRRKIEEATVKMDSGSGVIILTDMFGGTPSNLSIAAMDSSHAEVIAGINLPMLIKLLTVRHSMPMMDAVLEAQEAGRKYINVASNLLKKPA